MHERTNIRLSRADRSTLEAAVADRNSPQKHAWRARIVLLTADGHGTAEIMGATTGKAKTVIWRWQDRFREEGAAGLWRDKTRPSRIPPLRPEIAKRVVALTLSGPPASASHWTGSAMAKAAGISISSVGRGTSARRSMVLLRRGRFGASLFAERKFEPAFAVLLTDRHTFFAKHLQARAPADLNQFTSLTSGVGSIHINLWRKKNGSHIQD
jgi:hypothetical protein